jgi:hypothetical protein
MAAHVQAGSVRPQKKGVDRTETLEMPACPIKAYTVAPTKTQFQLPRRDPVSKPVSVAGTIQVTDQSSSTIVLLQTAFTADDTGVSFARTLKTIQHATGQLTFDKGCTKTDPYGSNNCLWDWDQQVTAAYQSTLQEDITAGKLIVDLKVDDTTPLQFACSVCGAPCTISVPHDIDHGRWHKIWDLMMFLVHHEPGLDWGENQQ